MAASARSHRSSSTAAACAEPVAAAAARTQLAAALDIFTTNGEELWMAQPRDEIARLGGRTPSGNTLTEAETRVVVLVADGRTRPPNCPYRFEPSRPTSPAPTPNWAYAPAANWQHDGETEHPSDLDLEELAPD